MFFTFEKSMKNKEKQQILRYMDIDQGLFL